MAEVFRSLSDAMTTIGPGVLGDGAHTYPLGSNF